MNAAARAYLEELAARPEVRAVLTGTATADATATSTCGPGAVWICRAVDERDGPAFELLLLSDSGLAAISIKHLDTVAEF